MIGHPGSLSVALRCCAETAGGEVALIGIDGSTLTYRQWNGRADGLAAVLRARIAPDDTVIGLFSEYSDIARAVALFAAVRAGCFVMPMSGRCDEDVVAGAALTHSVRLILADCDGAERTAARTGLDVIRIDAITETGDEVEPPLPGGAVVHTAGTTARPAAVRWAQSDLLTWLTGWTGIPQYRPHLQAFRSDSGDTLGRIIRTLLRYPGTRGPVTEPDGLVAVINEHRPVDVLIVGACAERLADGPLANLDREAADGVLSVYMTYGFITAETIDLLRRSFPNATVTNVYGVAEAGRGQTWKGYQPSAGSPRDEGTPTRHGGLTAVGAPIFDTEIRITDGAGRVLPPGAIGHIRIRPGLGTSLSYCPGAGRVGVFRDGWVCTDDLGLLDESGNLYLMGRASAAAGERKTA
jgi:acyl-CoA synthetase (AMP-forming)/AMP-acid ligase II